jgi:hypothetical protein
MVLVFAYGVVKVWDEEHIAGIPSIPVSNYAVNSTATATVLSPTLFGGLTLPGDGLHHVYINVG